MELGIELSALYKTTGLIRIFFAFPVTLSGAFVIGI
jgi:hypothetical protein